MTDWRDQECKEPQVDNSRRRLALALLGGIAGGALLEACEATGGGSEAPAGPDSFDGLAEALSLGTVVAFDTCTDLTSNPGPAGSRQVAVVTGRLAIGDGGGGVFYWDPASSAMINGGTAFGSGASGRWIRIHDGVINARWFGAVGDGSTDDIVALAGAAAAANALPGGATLYIPRGSYRCSTVSPGVITIGSGVTVRGDGRSTSVFRDVASNTPVFFAQDSSNIIIRDLQLKYVVEHTYPRLIEIENCTDVTIHSCHFVQSGVTDEYLITQGAQPKLGILFRSGGGLHLTNCRFERMQAKCQGLCGGTVSVIANNSFIKPVDFAISLVTGEEGGSISDATISHNVIEDPLTSGGIYIGSDGEQNESASEVSRITVVGNTIKFTTEAVDGRGILVYLGVVSRNLTFVGNIVQRETHVNGSHGIQIRSNNETCTYDGIVITGNQCDGGDQYGIQVYGDGNNLVVANNKVTNGRGIHVQPFGSGTVSNVAITGNVCTRNSCGIYVYAATGNVKSVSIASNVCVDQRGGFENGYRIWLQAATGKTLQALVSGNSCSADLFSSLGQAYGIRQEGAGTQVVYNGNDCAGNYIAGLQMVSGSAIGSGNRGGGFPALAPTAGTWVVGDRAQNHSPAVGQAKGWVCTVAGTPGTWVSEGNL